MGRQGADRLIRWGASVFAGGGPPPNSVNNNYKYVVQVPTERGWLTITRGTKRKNAHRLAERLGGRVYNLWTRRESRTIP